MPTSVCDSVAVTEATHLTTGQLAAALGVDKRTVYRWIARYHLRWERRTLGGHYRWVLADVEEQLAEAHPGGQAGRPPVE